MLPRSYSTLIILLLLTFASQVAAESHDVDPDNWCGTQKRWEEKIATQGVLEDAYVYTCPEYGPCDIPGTRDTWIPAPETPMTYVRLAIHYLANNDGSNPITNATEVQHAVNLLNDYYLPYRIQFDYVVDQINVTEWRLLSTSEIEGMKGITVVDPEHFLNIWVTTVDFGYSYGTFPWDNDALTAQSGIVLGHFHWNQSTYGTLAHEIGHCLGLWHTFNGTEEVNFCGSCYERLDAEDRNVLGDRCADTPPSPNWGSCSSPSGVDTCSNLPWGDTQPSNFMGYTPHWCRTLFTPQQSGRMRCWTDHFLAGWKSPVLIEADAAFGSAPHVVALSGNSFRQVDSWYWDFGDEMNSTQATPNHLYPAGGLYTVSLDIETPEGPASVIESDLVWVEADTISIDAIAVGPGEPIGLEVSVANYIPVRQMILPINWSAENGLILDSISTLGLRTDGLEVSELLDIDNFSREAAIQLVSTTSGDPFYIDPGQGPVVTLWFSAVSSVTDTTHVDIVGYGPFSPMFSCDKGFYEPDSFGGAIYSASCCQGRVGDANGSGEDEPTISDISTIIDMLFITTIEVACLPEADINQSGGPGPARSDITVGDISTLIDYLFIAGPSIGLPDCL